MPLKITREDIELIQEIGEGSYGKVYQARIKSTGAIIAVKSIPLERDDNLWEIDQEVQFLEKCEHENVIKFYGRLTVRETAVPECWLITEFCGAGAVSDVMVTAERVLSEREVAYVMRESLKGLDYLHKKHIIHRDIKGNNILLTMDGELKLCDFGVSGAVAKTMGKRFTMIGTPYWMAPEVINETGHTIMADIWSMGIVAIELAQGCPPYSNKSPSVALMKIGTLKRPPTFNSPGKHSEIFRDFVSKCLKLDPKERLRCGDLLKHPFLTQPLPRSLMTELIAVAAKKAEEADETEGPIGAGTAAFAGAALTVQKDHIATFGADDASTIARDSVTSGSSEFASGDSGTIVVKKVEGGAFGRADSDTVVRDSKKKGKAKGDKGGDDCDVQ
ncbi:Serine/threonine-protein kinase 3 [Aduncisulcus paluster]|uniref:non-specific serine/threonine protein kinase n=1 Tax=Aduncisulcus paluster TaxID=2918883 RepID=A0ABQ5JQX0_9EUKA|nr:Serine/threonine-protein kinase 3 [Aduncisulcus paluster]